MGEWIVAVGVDTELSKDEVGFECSCQVRDDCIEGLVPQFVIGVRSEREC